MVVEYKCALAKLHTFIFNCLIRFSFKKKKNKWGITYVISQNFQLGTILAVSLGNPSKVFSRSGRSLSCNQLQIANFQFKNWNFTEYFAIEQRNVLSFIYPSPLYFGWYQKVLIEKIFVNCRNPATIQILCNGAWMLKLWSKYKDKIGLNILFSCLKLYLPLK